jgi:hypothetical protein
MTMKTNNPKNQTTDDIVISLLDNKSRQYTESAHAEIFSRLIKTIESFNLKAEKTEKVMLTLAAAQVILAIAQVFLAVVQLNLR